MPHEASTPPSEPVVMAAPLETTNEVSPFKPTNESGAMTPAAITPATGPDAAADAKADAKAAAAVAVAEENPFDEAVYRSSTRDAEIEIAGANPVVGGPLARFASNKRNVAIVIGGALLVIVGLVFALGGDDKPSSKQASKSSAKKTEKKSKPGDTTTPAAANDETPSAAGDETPGEASGETPGEATGDTPGEVAGEAAGETPSDNAEGSAKPSDATGDVAADKPDKPVDKPDKPVDKPDKPTDKPDKPKGPTIGGKPVVLEYDTQAREAKPVAGVAKEDQAAIAKARTSYAAGNQKLFAGDADSAIRNYRQALASYPAYVAGYRGLGLAYAQKGDKANAIKALRTYVSAAPRAKDAALIRKRIETLSK